jgi:hypothetical protein
METYSNLKKVEEKLSYQCSDNDVRAITLAERFWSMG